MHGRERERGLQMQMLRAFLGMLALCCLQAESAWGASGLVAAVLVFPLARISQKFTEPAWSCGAARLTFALKPPLAHSLASAPAKHWQGIFTTHRATPALKWRIFKKVWLRLRSLFFMQRNYSFGLAMSGQFRPMGHGIVARGVKLAASVLMLRLCDSVR